MESVVRAFGKGLDSVPVFSLTFLTIIMGLIFQLLIVTLEEKFFLFSSGINRFLTE